jgi:hypothetical protein
MADKICPTCKIEKPLSDYWMRKTRGGQQAASRCKVCSTEENRKWRAANPDHEKLRYARERVQTRERHLVRKYGVDLSAYSAMLEDQAGACAICGKPDTAEHHGVLHVDHCHSTGAVRGLLCRNCNHVLGLMKDGATLMDKAAEYLRRAILQAEGRA